MKYPLVEVTWKDAAHYAKGSWITNTDTAKPVIAKTIGWLLRRNRLEIAVAQKRSDDLDQWGGVWVIPAGWVTKVRRLKG